MGRVAKNDVMSTKTLGFGELGAPKDVLVEGSRPGGPFYRLIVSVSVTSKMSSTYNHYHYHVTWHLGVDGTYPDHGVKSRG
jgi:hypothetical protein